MSAKKKQGYQCPYGECKLPKDNKLLAVQIWFWFVCWLVMLVSFSAINSLSIFMYTFPLIFDLNEIEPQTNFMSFAKKTLYAIIFTIFALCIAILFGLLIDAGTSFQFSSTAVLCSGVKIPKLVIVGLMLLLLGAPASAYSGRRTQGQMTIATSLKSLET